MQNPVNDIKGVILELAASDSPDVQQSAVYKYYTPTAGFRHPLARVDSGPLSREQILGVWQWFRVLSPKISIKVENVVYDKPHDILLLEVAQQFHISFSPFKPATSRALTRLTLVEDDGLYRIGLQEDFYHPEDVAAMICPPLASLAEFTLHTFASISNFLAKSFQVLNYWRPMKTGVVYGVGCTERRAGDRQKSNDQKERGKNGQKSHHVKDKTPDTSVVSKVQQPRLAKQGKAEEVNGNKSGQNPYGGFRNNEDQTQP